MSRVLGGIGIILALPGLFLLMLADRLDEAKRVREMEKEYGA